MIHINKAEKHWERCNICRDECNVKIGFEDRDGQTTSVKLCSTCQYELYEKLHDNQLKKGVERMSALNHDAYDLNKQVKTLVFVWEFKNRGRKPRYIFLSPMAYKLLKTSEGFDLTRKEFDSFMGIEIAPVGVPGIYAAIGDHFN